MISTHRTTVAFSLILAAAFLQLNQVQAQEISASNTISATMPQQNPQAEKKASNAVNMQNTLVELNQNNPGSGANMTNVLAGSKTVDASVIPKKRSR